MSFPPPNFDYTTGYQSPYQNGPLNPTSGQNQLYYNPGPPPSPGLPQSPHPPPNQHQHLQSPAPVQQYPAHPAPGVGALPPGQQAQYAAYSPYASQPHSNQQFAQHSQQYPQQLTYAPQPHNPPPYIPQWQLQRQSGCALVPGQQQYMYIIYTLPTPASPGYDESQNVSMPLIDVTHDIDTLRKAMKGRGCDNRALIRVFVDPKYRDPRVLNQLKDGYQHRFGGNLLDDIKSETKGDFEIALQAFIQGPLNHDIYALEKALSLQTTDEDLLNDVLLRRSNADIHAIVNRYNSTPGRDLLQLIRSKVNNDLFHLYSIILSSTRAEDITPAVPADTDYKVAEIHRLIQGSLGANTNLIINILAGANAAQLRAINDAYRQEYGCSLQSVIGSNFVGGIEDALLLIVDSAESGKPDAENLDRLLNEKPSEDILFIYQALRLYWGDSKRLQEAQAAYLKFYRKRLADRLKMSRTGDYMQLMVALIGESPASIYTYR